MTPSTSRFGARFLLCCLAICLSASLAEELRAQSAPIRFEEFLVNRFTSASETKTWQIDDLCPVSTSRVARRVLAEYGSMFAAEGSILLPESCIQRGESEVKKFQAKLGTGSVELAGLRIELQSSAAAKLRLSADEIAPLGLKISPLDGRIAGRRSYGDTLMLWNSRVFPALEFWIKRGRLPESARDELARLDLARKIEKILEWEATGMCFSTGRTRSILTSTAPPGASQHLSLIAFDVVEYWNSDVRAALNRNGWFQTIVDDPPHFTYLGYPETDLPGRGLRAVFKGGHRYWVPNISPEIGSAPAR